MLTINKKSLATATIAATALAGLGLATAPGASAAETATKTVTKTFTQNCQTVGPLGARSFPSTITVTQPVSVKRGAAFSITTKLKINVPASVNTSAAALGADQQVTTLTVVNVNTTLLSKATTDLTGAGSAKAPKAPVTSGKPSTLVFPALKTAFKAGAKAGNAAAKTGSITGNFQLYKNGAALGGPLPLQCAAQNVLVTSIKIV